MAILSDTTSRHYHLNPSYGCLQGLGVVCNHPAGFEKDEFIVEFFGEVLLLSIILIYLGIF